LDLEELGPEDQGLSIGVSGGRSIKEMMACVTGEYGGNLWLVPLSGSRLPDDATISVNTIIGQFCGQPGRSEVKGLQLPLDPRARAAMFDVDYEKAVGTRLRKYYIQDSKTRQESDPPPVHYAFTGVGSLDKTGAIPRLEALLHIKRPPGTIGDMLDWPINRDGVVLGDSVEIRHHVVGVRPDELQLGRNRATRGKAKIAAARGKKADTGNLKKVIVVAGSDGVTKLKDKAILAAWRGGLFDVLVTDVRTARAMLGEGD
jgi:DNA-binding transcriptional regulator LsrR (DeoR family)